MTPNNKEEEEEETSAKGPAACKRYSKPNWVADVEQSAPKHANVVVGLNV